MLTLLCVIGALSHARKLAREKKRKNTVIHTNGGNEQHTDAASL